MSSVMVEECGVGRDFFFFNDTATTEIYTLSLHDALPICSGRCATMLLPNFCAFAENWHRPKEASPAPCTTSYAQPKERDWWKRSEEHTSELQSRQYIVCRLLLEKKNHP